MLSALDKLLQLDITYGDEFNGESSIAVMVEECEGFQTIESLLMSDHDSDLKKKAKNLLDQYYTD